MATAKSENKEVGAAANTEVALASEYEAYAGSGFENQTSDDYAIPFLQILQALSPQVEEDPKAFTPGMLFNTVTGEIFEGETGVVFVPALTEHNYIEWRPRDAGGGFIGVHEVNSEVVTSAIEASDEYGKYSTPDGNDLIETFSVFGILLDDEGNASETVISFTSSKIKKYKAWMTKAKTIQIPLPDGRRIPAPLFAHKYRMKAVKEKSSKGSFYNWEIGFDGANAMEARLAPSDPIFQSAVGIKQLLDKGAARADYASQKVNDEAATSDDDGKPEGRPKF